MGTKTKKEKIRFWIKWTLLNALVIIICVPLCFIIAISDLFLKDVLENKMAGFILVGVALGFGIGLIQWLLFRKVLHISVYWISDTVLGFVLINSLAGFFLSKTGSDIYAYSYFDGDVLPSAILYGIGGLLIGLLQLPKLEKHFSGSILWVIASSFAWFCSILITAIGNRYDVVVLITFVLGALLYGAITGATLMWIMKPKEIK